MDPFTILPPEVCDTILHNLSGSDILTATTVSTAWNSIIGASVIAMQKISLKLNHSLNVNINMMELIAASERKYQNVVLNSLSNSIVQYAKVLKARSRIWKFVMIEHLIFDKSSDFLNFIELFGTTVEELAFQRVYIGNVDDWRPLELPNLKILKFINIGVYDQSIIDLFVGCRNLKELSIRSCYSSSNSTAALQKILKQNDKLKKLEITSQLINAVTEQNGEFKFKLDTFITTNYCHLRIRATHLNILQKQVMNLQYISFDETSSVETLKVLFSMPKLKTLCLGTIDSSNMILSNLLINVNKTIEKLSFEDIERKFSVMKCLVDAAPNIKDIEMFSLTQDMMEYLSLTAKHLKVLKLRTIDASNISMKHLFPQLRKLDVDIVSAELEDKISWVPVEKANPFVKLLKQTSFLMLH